MKENHPVTDREIELQDGQMIVTRTDLQGDIEYVNRDFVAISGFSEAELIGAHHNIVRHPDMPPAAFANLWATLKAGRPWIGLVKNRAKNGDFYWVEARVTPVRNERHEITGYLSVRRKPSRAQIDRAAEVYRRLREGRAGEVRLAQGTITRRHALDRLVNGLRDLPFMMKLAAAIGVPMALASAASLKLSGAWPLVLCALLQAGAAFWLARSTVRPLAAAIDALRHIARSDYTTRIDVTRNDEFGRLLQAVVSMQTRLGFDIAETRRFASENLRVRTALDSASTNVMVADASGHIIYVNKTLERNFREAEVDFRKALPQFRVDALVGSHFDVFHKNPAHQRRLIEQLRSPHRARVEIGGRHFELLAAPIVDADGSRAGTVVEWTDRALEIFLETEVGATVEAAIQGDFSRRIDTGRLQGTYAELAKRLNQLMNVSEQGLKDAAKVFAALADANLTARINSDYSGLFAEMKDSAARTMTQLSEMIRRIRSTVESVNTAATEIAQGNAGLASRTESQASSLQQTASSMEQINSTVRLNADNARQASELAAGAARLASDGGTVMREVVATMSDIAHSSQRIQDIVGVIDSIAFQTNILALNAAVEAARAGEQGRGFAVVAGEVRNLAQRSASAAKETAALITDSTARVTSGAALVGRAGEQMNQIVESVRRTNTVITEIASSSREQSSGLDQINQAVSQMDQITQQNAALVEQATAAAESLEEMSRELAKEVELFKLLDAAAPLTQSRPPATDAGSAARSARDDQTPRYRQAGARRAHPIS